MATKLSTAELANTAPGNCTRCGAFDPAGRNTAGECHDCHNRQYFARRAERSKQLAEHHRRHQPGQPREKYPDGRLIPQAREIVTCVVRGFGGTAAYLTGRVYLTSRKTPRVKITGGAAIVGVPPVGATCRLGSSWSVENDPELKRRELAKQQAEAAKQAAARAEREEHERRQIEFTERYGSLKFADLAIGDQLESVEGERAEVIELEAAGKTFSFNWVGLRWAGDESTAQGRNAGNLNFWRKID